MRSVQGIVVAFTLTIWLVAIALESLLLCRAVAKKFIGRFALFYTYLVFILLRDVGLLVVYFLWPHFYPQAYWVSEPVGVLMGCALVWEVYKCAFARYPGAARVARNVLVFLFIFATARILVKAWESPNWVPGRTAFEIERDLRIVQGALLLGLVILFAYYAIRLGRNLNGIVGGYGLFLATSVINLTLRNNLGRAFQRQWQLIQPACYLLVLALWCLGLWSYASVPEPEVEPALERDYQALRARTKTKLSAARARLLRDIHP
jgi:hypothetical protein